MLNVAFFCDLEPIFQSVYDPTRRARIAADCAMHPVVVTSQNLEAQLPALADVQVIFSTWGMPALTAAQLARLPSLRAVFYAAGTVKAFATPILEKGITLVSAWAGNAVPVAEFTLSQILLANKGYFRNCRACTSAAGREQAFRGAGNYEQTVALLGAGMIGRKVIELLQPFRLQIIVFDPFLSAEAAAQLGVEKVSLDEAFTRGQVVSNHLANVPETCGLLQRTHFAAMRENAVFINTGRGATVVEAEMIEVLRRRPDLSALLDVTEPEPPLPDSPLYTLPNVFLSSHIAGSMGTEVLRMADLMLEEFQSWRAGQPLRYAVSLEMLKTMA
ncbi:MAG: hydroxyacid dehydrogenase [Kiritimatiellia bacterium]